MSGITSMKTAADRRRPAAAVGGSPSGGPALLRHPPLLGLTLLLALTSAVLLTQTVQGRVPFGPGGELRDFKSILSHVFLVSYLPPAYLAVVAGARRRLEQLEGLIPTGSAQRWIRIPPAVRPTEAWVAVGLTGVFLAVLGPSLTEPTLHNDFWDPAGWSPEVFWHRGLGLLAGMWLGWFFYAVGLTARVFSLAARDLSRVDLLDTRPLRPFAQQGLSNGLLAAGTLSIGGLFVLDQGITPMMVLLEGGSMAMVAVALALPVLGIRDRIREAKRAELARCDEAIRRESDAFRAGASPAPGSRLPELVAYRGLVEQVREWPVDAPAAQRMILYLLLPLGSWVASAVVQHFIERAIALR